MKEKKLIPKRRFKEFINDDVWEERKLSNLIKDIADGPFGSNLKTVHYTENTEARIIQLSNISESGWHDENVRYTTFKHANEISRSIVESGNLVMAKMMPAGLTIVCPNTDEMYVLSSDAVKIILIEEEVDSRYFVYMTKSDYFLNQINNDAQGSTRTRTSISKIKKMDIPVPRLSEQQKISTFFIELDNLITLNHRKLNKLKETKSAYLSEMFPEEGEKYPKRRFAGFTDPWEQCKLGDMCSITTGYAFNSIDFDDNGEFLVITNGNIQKDSPYVNGSIGNRIDIKDNIILKEYVLDKNEILVTMDGTVGRIAKVLEKKQILAQRVGRLIAKSDSEFLYQFLNTGDFFNKMSLIAHGGTIKHISLTEISDYVGYVPSSNKEQQKIGIFFNNLDNLITIHQQKLEKLENLKKAYLNEMFV